MCHAHGDLSLTYSYSGTAQKAAGGASCEMGQMDKLGAINQEIDKLLYGLGQEGLLDDQFAQLMQLQVQ